MPKPDFILNGQPYGTVAKRLIDCNFDARALRPFEEADGRTYVTVNQGGVDVAVPTHNATATLRKDEWIKFDQAILKAAKPRLRALSDLRAAGLEYGIPNGMGNTVLQYEAQSDISDAEISMDALRQTPADLSVVELLSLPLPIISKNFRLSARQLAASRNGSRPLDTTTAELAGEKVAEMAEKLLLGEVSTYSYGGGTVAGYTTFGDRLTKSLTNPAGGGWTPNTLVTEVLAMKLQSTGAYHYGPWMLYFSPAWDTYLDDDYSAAKGDNTLRERLAKIDNIQGVRTLDYLSDTTCLLVQMTPSVVRAIIGMEITTVQWEEQGGLELLYKVMAIMVPQIRSDINDRTGIVHGSV